MADRYICVATRLRLASPSHLPAFLRASMTAARVARRTPGVVRSRVLGLPPLLVFHTLSVWESEAAMTEFVRSPEHRAAMGGFETWAAMGKFVRFSSETRRVSWRRAMRALRDPDGIYQRGAGYSRRAVTRES